jgi:RHS repeat-associated protein
LQRGNSCAIVYHPHATLVKSHTFSNGLNDFNTFTQDYELDVLGTYNGAVNLINRAHTRTDALNLTNIFDNVSTANNQSYWSNAANQLQNANGPWGAKTFYYDGVGNRTSEASTPVGGALTTDTYGYPATSNRLVQITRGTTTVRTLAYDNAGSLTSDSGAAGNKTYVYNKRNRLASATIGAIQWTYVYNGLEQLTTRTRVGASPADIAHYVHDIWGNIIAETDGGGATGATGTVREYVYLPEAEIAPTMGARTVVDRPVAVVDAVNTATPVTWFVHVDHLHRPIKMTNAAKAVVWDAVWLPWGGVHSITGSATLDARFPGQWFQLETGLHYNWHRSYDPAIGRYTQFDPLGFVDGPSVYGYAGGSPGQNVDSDGQLVQVLAFCVRFPHLCAAAAASGAELIRRAVMPPITRPARPSGGQCSCTCRAGDPSNILTYRFARSTLNSCAAAAIDACKRAVNYCPPDTSAHHSQAQCSDGSNRGGNGRIAQ